MERGTLKAPPYGMWYVKGPSMCKYALLKAYNLKGPVHVERGILRALHVECDVLKGPTCGMSCVIGSSMWNVVC